MWFRAARYEIMSWGSIQPIIIIRFPHPEHIHTLVIYISGSLFQAFRLFKICK